MSFEEALELRRDLSNKTPGNLGGLDCPVCLNRGYVAEVRDGYLVTVDCECMVKRRCLRYIERSGMKALLDRYTLERFQTPAPWQDWMKRTAMAYLEDWREKWFAALGAVGAGKTHICTAICGELLNAGQEVRYMLWRDESVLLKGLVNDPEEYERRIRVLKTTPVLYIDDLFKTRKGEEIRAADVNLAFEILNARYCAPKLSTILSSEKTLDELMAIDEAIGSRIYEKSKGYCLQLTGDKNQRL